MAERVHWLTGDITMAQLQPREFDVWHDRAVFHFLTDPQQRIAYVQQVARSVKPGGYVIISTFGPDGPTQCSGLNVVRYDSQSLHREFGSGFGSGLQVAHYRGFRLVDSSKELHNTPFGAKQQFLYCYCKVEEPR